MKKSFTVNINGTLFNIDEDAFNQLNNYLDQLRKAFPGDEGAEIVNDIESRIAELLGDYASQGINIITIDHVNGIISQIGQPQDMGAPDPANHSTVNQGNASNNQASNPTGSTTSTPPPFNAPASTGKRLYRNMQNKVFGGVIGGLAAYLGWDPTIMRILLVLIAFIPHFGGPLIIIYLLGWMIIPPAVTPRQILEMHGTPVTLSSLGATFLGTPAPGSSTNVVSTVGNVIGAICMGFLGLVGCCVGIGMLVLFIVMICALVNYATADSLAIMQWVDMFPYHHHPLLAILGTMAFALAWIIPCVWAVWGAATVIFKAKGASKQLMIGAAVAELIIIIIAAVLLSISQVSLMSVAASAAVGTATFFA